MKIKIVYSILLICLILSCNKEQEFNIKIASTTDLHGSFFPENLLYGNTKLSLANVSTYLKELRAKNKNVIMLDNGDLLQGEPTVYYYNYVKTDSENIGAKVLNYLKYDASSIGNHDIETGHEVYDKLKNEFKFPWLSANIIDIRTNQPYFKPYTILIRNGVKIAILGLTTPAIPNWLPPKIWQNMKFEDMIMSSKKYMEILKNKEKVDIVIGLFHSGVNYKYNNQNEDTFKNENASILVAKNVPGFNVIFTGHDHSICNKKIKNIKGDSVLVLNAKNAAKFIAEATISVKKKNDKIILSKIEGSIISMKNYSLDSTYLNYFKDERIELNKYVNQKIGFNEKSIIAKKSIYGSSEFVDLIHNIQLDISKADISFAAPLSLKSKIKKGAIYVKDMFKLYKYENLLYTMELSGKEIRDFLEFSYSKWLDDGTQHILLFNRNKTKLKNVFFNFDSAAGLIYTVDITKPIGQRVSIKSLSNMKPFKEKNLYKVAINSYRGNGGGGHLIKGAGINKSELQSRISNSTDRDLRYFLMQWIKKQKVINPKPNGNWVIVPKQTFDKLINNDIRILDKITSR